MITLYDLLKIKYPTAKIGLGGDVELADQGQGAYIQIWNLEDPEPSVEDLTTWSHDATVIITNFTNKTEESIRVLVESKPKERGYDSVTTLSSYTTSTVIQWKNEADAFLAWRDSVFSYCYSQLDAVLQNQRELPTSVEEFIAELPALIWP